MFDCGSSKTRSSKKDKHRDSSSSVISSVSGSYRSVRSRYEPSRRCIENDAICDLVDSLRYSGRSYYNDDRRHNRVLDYIDDRRHSGYRMSEKVRSPHSEPKCDADFLRFDGGSSKSAYVSGPIFDFGSSSANQHETDSCTPTNKKTVDCTLNHLSPGNNSTYSKIILDGGTNNRVSHKILVDGGAASTPAC